MPKMSVPVNGAHASDLKAALCGFQPACLALLWQIYSRDCLLTMDRLQYGHC